MAFGNVHIGGDSLLRLLAAVAGKAAKQRVARASRFGAVQVFTGQGAERQAGIGQQLNAFKLAHF